MLEESHRVSSRYDGSSPLPLGMEASPAPARWTGADTIWPHDPHAGWRYCVMIPSWIVLPEDKLAANGHDPNSVVFYRVQVGIRSPEGISTLHGILRRFSDFLKLHSALKRMFPNKKLPLPPPKKSFMQMISSKSYLQQRRFALSDWIMKLLIDVDISRSAPISSFLELEEASNLACPGTSKRETETCLKTFGNQEQCLTQEDEDFQVHEDRSDTASNLEGDIVETSLNSPGRKAGLRHRHGNSIDSDASDLSFASGSELSVSTPGDYRELNSDGMPSFDADILKSIQALLPLNQRGYVRRTLATLQRRMSSAKDDMEDLVARLNQETAVKEFLTAKVRDLEVQVHRTQQKSMESLQEALSVEREGYKNLQWELEESKIATFTAQEEARLTKEEMIRAKKQLQAVETENRRLMQELSDMKEKCESLQIDRDNIKAKATTETKLLAKEIKALRKSQPELKEKLEVALDTNTDLMAQVKQEQKHKENILKILEEVAELRERLQQCTVDSLAKEDARSGENNGAVIDAADLLMTSDNRIGLLIAEAQLLSAEENVTGLTHQTSRTEFSNGINDGNSSQGSVELIRKMLTEIFIDNAHLHKLVNSLTLKTLQTDPKLEKGKQKEASTKKSMLNRWL